MPDKLQFTIVTGLSGAGKTQAMKVLEDLDYFCIDNLPPTLLPNLVAAHAQAGLERRYAVAIDIRLGEQFGGLRGALQWLRKSGHAYRLIFLECSDAVLVRRFSETRRVHPLAKSHSIFDSIAKERLLLADAREMADVIIDTSDLRPMDLRTRLVETIMGIPLAHALSVELFSFGYKYGVPVDADIVFDVRFITNPFYIPELKPLTGKDKPVADYVLNNPITQKFIPSFAALLLDTIPAYSREGKIRLSVGIGCTGGQHRSVAIADALGDILQQKADNLVVNVRHRELELINQQP